MTIAEVSRMFEISVDTLRYYERIGLLPAVPRTPDGIRDYGEKDLGWIAFIKCMRSAGLPTEALIEYVELFQQGDVYKRQGLNYPAYETLEKIMEVLDVTPNELLSGEWKYVNQSEKEVCQLLRAEERLNAELKHGHYDNFFDSEEEWLEYELEKLREYITDYINGKSIEASDLYPIKEFIQHLKFQKLL